MANNPQPDLLLTKLHPPASPPQLVPRPRLRQRLAAGLAGPVTLVTAPAGFGKTALLAELAAHRRPPLAWLSLDEHDNDPLRFWSYLIAALQTRQPHVGEQALAVLHAPSPPDPAVILTLLLNSIHQAGAEITLVLDDCQCLENGPLTDGLSYLAAHLPACLHLVLLSRDTPPLPLAQLLARGQLTRINAEALRFTNAETGEFLSQALGARATPEIVTALVAQTAGWAAGLQLAAGALRAAENPAELLRGLSRSRRLMQEFLTEQVIQRQPEHVQSFLLHTSILERLSASLCQAVAACPDAQAMLEQLERAELFIEPLDDERRWFRYQPLFAASLRRLAAAPGRARLDMPELHRRASRWFEGNGALREAIEHALAAPDAARAADLIEPGSEALLRRGETATVLRWLLALPEAVVRARPGLCLWAGWCYALSGQAAPAEDYLQTLERLSHNRRARPSAAASCQQAQARQLAGQVALIRSQLAISAGQLAQARAHARRALARLPAQDDRLRGLAARNLGAINLARGELAAAEPHILEACRASQADGHFFILLASRQQLARLRLEQNRLAEAEQTARQVLALAGQQGMRLLAHEALLTLARVGGERNQLAAALEQAAEALALARLAGGPASVCESLLVCARLQQALGDTAAADDCLAQARLAAAQLAAAQLAAPQSAAGHMPRWAGAWQARLWLLQGRTELAVAWSRPAWPAETTDFERITQARVWLARGQWPAALAALRAVRRRALAAGRQLSALEAHIVLALAQQASGQRRAALASVRQALVLAEPAGNVRLFLDDGPALRDLLSQLAASRPSQPARLMAFIDDIRRQLPAPAGPAGTLLAPLTAGEAQVLGWLARGLSNRAMAQELVVAQSTVEWHLKNIYSKLAVHSRTQALAHARALRLVE